MGIGSRIKKVRELLGLSQKEFAEKIGVGRTTITQIENETIPIRTIILVAISSVFNVNYKWLEKGEGNVFKNENIMSNLDNYTLSILKMLLEMSEDEKKSFLEIVKREKQISDMKKELEELKKIKTG